MTPHDLGQRTPVEAKFIRFTPTATALVALHTIIALIIYLSESQQLAGVHGSYSGWGFLFLLLIDFFTIPLFFVVDLLTGTQSGIFLLMIYFQVLGGIQWMVIGNSIHAMFSNKTWSPVETKKESPSWLKRDKSAD